MPGCRAGPRRRVVSPSGGSILMTSAPRSPRVCAAQGPSTTVVTSRTRMPTSGPGMSRHAPGASAHAIGEIRSVGVERGERTELADRLELVGPPVDRDDRAAELPGHLDHRDALGHRKEIPRREREVFGVAAIRGHADLPAQAAAERLVREAAEITVVAKEVLRPPAVVAVHVIEHGEPDAARFDAHEGVRRTDARVADGL